MESKSTTVIQLWGGPGSGKSTTAAGLFSRMKLAGKSVELVTEYVKGWAWRDIPVGPFDQLYILGKQAFRESQLYGKVDYIVTDCPIQLSAFYEQKYSKCRAATSAVEEFIKFTDSNGIRRVNFFLERKKPYVQDGRYQTESEAQQVDWEIEDFLHYPMNIMYIEITGEDHMRPVLIDDHLYNLGI